MARLPSLAHIWKMISFSVQREELPVLNEELLFKTAGEVLTLEDSTRSLPLALFAGRSLQHWLNWVSLLSKCFCDSGIWILFKPAPSSLWDSNQAAFFARPCSPASEGEGKRPHRRVVAQLNFSLTLKLAHANLLCSTLLSAQGKVS